ncbi:MAG: class I SAM-dependent methyltransferase [Bacteroidales bacterium]|nr:class I SAM-dependent methyltransferase [Bacteroidales bacterium]
MYNNLKQILKGILPRKALFQCEPFLHRILYLFYKGNKYQCNICNGNLRSFIVLADGDKLCPKCGSISRNRRLWGLLKKEFIRDKITILDFSPSRCLYRILEKNNSITYIGSDISGDFLSEKQYDITKIDAKDDSFDLIICYHILEHIENDIKAMKEIYRILKKKGSCIIQTPFKEGDIYENPLIKTETERLKHFGQKDHVRVYSVDGLALRLSDCGFKTDIRYFEESSDNEFGLNIRETILVCSKQ